MKFQCRLTLILIILLSYAFGYSQANNHLLKVIAAKGTGQTTGHIATLNVKNKGDVVVELAPQTFFIASEKGETYQNYVGRIPAGRSIPPGEVKTVKVNGYCTDVHSPPVPAGLDMPPVSDWIPVKGDVEYTFGSNTQTVITTEPVPRFDLSQIGIISASPGFTRWAGDPDDHLQTAWPGSNSPIGGTLDANAYPRDFAGLIIEIVELIEGAAENLINNDEVSTPFSGNKIREKAAIVQQTTWIVMADLSGEGYNKADFADNVYEQYEGQTGVSVGELGDQQKAQIEHGVDDFWGAFQATGVEAKVLVNQEGASGEGQNEGEEDNDDGGDDEEEEEPGDCECESLSANFSLEKSGGLPYSKTIAVRGGDFKNATQEFDEQATFSIGKGDEFTASITVASLECSCSTGGDCPQVFPDKDAVEDNEDQGDFSMKLLSHSSGLDPGEEPKTKTGASASWELDATANSENTQKLKFEISAYCQADNCQKERCKYKFEVEINPESQEEED